MLDHIYNKKKFNYPLKNVPKKSNHSLKNVIEILAKVVGPCGQKVKQQTHFFSKHGDL